MISDSNFKNLVANDLKPAEPEFKKRLMNVCDQIFNQGNEEVIFPIPNVPKRMQFETSLFMLGEEIRQFVRKNKSVAKSGNFIEGIKSIVSKKKFKRGRESFVMLFGDFRIVYESKFLSAYLNDEYIYGHVILTLRKMKCFDYSEKISSILESEKRTWIKNECKKYLNAINKMGHD